MAVIDTLKLSRALRAAGMAPEQAEAVSTALNDAFTSQVAEKRDVDGLRTELKHDIETVRVEIEAVRTELKHDIEAVRVEIEAVRTELKRDIEAVRIELGGRLTFQQWQLGAILALLVGLLIKLLVFQP